MLRVLRTLRLETCWKCFTYYKIESEEQVQEKEEHITLYARVYHNLNSSLVLTTLWNFRIARAYNKFTKVVINKCDICDEYLVDAPDNIELNIDVLAEIDDSYESQYDKHEPRLLLCTYCEREYMVPSYLTLPTTSTPNPSIILNTD